MASTTANAFADEGAYGRKPQMPGVQDSAYSGVYEAQRGAEAKAKPAKPVDPTTSSLSSAEMATNPNLPPFLRTNNRWSYMTEYVDFWRNEKICWIFFSIWMAAAIFTFMVFPPASLIMFALAARFRNMAWWNRFVYGMFGTNRTIMTVD